VGWTYCRPRESGDPEIGGRTTDKRPCVDILASRRNGTLYVGVINDLGCRVAEHRANAVPGFTRRNGVHMRVFVEFHATIADAILREKRIKQCWRAWKLEAIKR
jgi:putative endonuclease